MRSATLKSIFDLALIFLVASIALSAVLQRAMGLTVGWLAIDGDSMAPTIANGSLVLCLPASPDRVKPGDIVVYKTAGVPPIVCHRVVGSGPAGLLTQGDANATLDQDAGLPPIDGRSLAGYVPQVAGKPIAIPLLGAMTTASSPLGGNLVVVLCLGCGLVFLGGSDQGRKRRRRRY